MRSYLHLTTSLFFLCGVFSIFAEERKVSFSSEELDLIKTLSPLPAVKADPTNKYSTNSKAVMFGEDLFNDWRLSRGEEFACQTCHRVTDHLMSVRNDTPKDIPTLWNLGYNKWFFWDGRADTLWSQALGPIENPKEHDSSRTEIASLISGDDNYRKVYKAIFGQLPPDFSDKDRFPEPAKPSRENEEANNNWQSMSPKDQMAVNKVFANVGKALAAFQMTLVSQKTDFDVFVEGLKENNEKKKEVLSKEAQRGIKLFIGKGKCVTCHSGPSFSDSEFHDTQLPEIAIDLGFKNARHGGVKEVKENIFNAAGPFSDAPTGTLAKRTQNLTSGSENKGRFKTPGLRNIQYTQPYMHTGQFRSLIDVINYYSDMKNAQPTDHPEIEPRNFTEEEKRDLIAFLESISSFAK